MAGFSEVKITRKLILLFSTILVLLVAISIASLLYLNNTIDRLSDSLFEDVYENSELILSADGNMYQAAIAIHSIMNLNITREERDKLSIEFVNNNKQAEERIHTAKSNIISINKPSGRSASTLLLSELEQELEVFESSLIQWQATGDELISNRVQNGPDSTSFSPILLNTYLNEARSSLNHSEELIGNYAEQVTDGVQEKKSALFALYSILFFILILVIFYLGREIYSLQKEMLEKQTLYQLIGETMSDFIILTDPNGLILYASPSHFSILGYVPQKGEPLSNYIREPEIAWAKLKSIVQETPRISELRMRGAEGNWIWLETKVSPVRGSRTFPVQFMLISREITQRKQKEERLHKLAFYDHLTAIPNRAHFKMYMENLINQPEDHRQNIAVALLDCDRFKQLNDTLGHLAGDDFLQQLSRELQHTVKGVGQAFRIGGDEFAVVLHRFTTPEMLDELLGRLLKLFNKTWSINNDSNFHTSASIGVALFPQHGNSINALLHAADIAMYRSKNYGGNKATLYYEHMDESLSSKTT